MIGIHTMRDEHFGIGVVEYMVRPCSPAFVFYYARLTDGSPRDQPLPWRWRGPGRGLGARRAPVGRAQGRHCCTDCARPGCGYGNVILSTQASRCGHLTRVRSVIVRLAVRRVPVRDGGRVRRDDSACARDAGAGAPADCGRGACGGPHALLRGSLWRPIWPGAGQPASPCGAAQAPGQRGPRAAANGARATVTPAVQLYHSGPVQNACHVHRTTRRFVWDGYGHGARPGLAVSWWRPPPGRASRLPWPQRRCRRA